MRLNDRLLQKKIQIIWSIVLSLLLVSCSYFSTPASIQSRDQEYLQAKNIPPLQIPPGLSSTAFQSYYPISTRHDSPNTQMVSLVPPGLMDK
jgi:uncharacterized lipoprotein